jgi:hypothetical protein
VGENSAAELRAIGAYLQTLNAIIKAEFYGLQKS